MTVQKAQDRIKRHMQSGGNWRFKAFFEAARDEYDVTPREMAIAWPDPGKKSDYRHLAEVEQAPNREVASRVIEMEASDRMLGESGSKTYEQLKHAKSVTKDEGDRTLSVGDVEEKEDGKILEAHTDHVAKRMLFASAPTDEVGTLFQEFLDDVVQDGARINQVARDAATVTNVDRDVGKLPVGSDDRFAQPVARGGEIRDNRENYTTVDCETDKHGDGARVLEETVEQANVDLIERQLQYLGASRENALNRKWIHDLVDNAFFDVSRVAESDSPNYKALNRGVGRIDLADFEADSYASHPGFRTALFEDEGIRFADRSGSDETVRDRTFDPLLDLQHYGLSGRVYLNEGDEDGAWDAGGNTWNYGDFYEDMESEVGDVGAVVYDSSNSHIMLRRDIETKDYDDPIRDITGVNARIEADIQYTQARSACTVTWDEAA